MSCVSLTVFFYPNNYPCITLPQENGFQTEKNKKQFSLSTQVIRVLVWVVIITGTAVFAFKISFGVLQSYAFQLDS